MQSSLGKMSAYKMFNWRDRAASSVEQTVAAFLELGEAIATRWIQTAKGVLLLQMVPDNSESGAIYVFDRQREQWYMLSFEGCEDQFTSEKFDRAFSEYDLFRLVEQPGLLLTEFQTGQRLAHLATPQTSKAILNSRRSRHASVRKSNPLDQPRDRQGSVVRLVRVRKNPRPLGPKPGASCLRERAQVREDRRRPKVQSRVGPSIGTGEETCRTSVFSSPIPKI